MSANWTGLSLYFFDGIAFCDTTASFVIIEAVDIIFPRLNFPDWTITFVMILLGIAFPIALFFSWIFDITPEGIEETKPLKDVQKEDKTTVSSSWRIASYVSVVVIIGLLAYSIFGGKNRAKIDESLAKSIAVFPFHNLSGDSSQDFICLGLTDEIIISVLLPCTYSKRFGD